jgi:hypothetical protein
MGVGNSGQRSRKAFSARPLLPIRENQPDQSDGDHHEANRTGG